MFKDKDRHSSSPWDMYEKKLFLKILFLFIFREKVREGERERNIDQLPLGTSLGLNPQLRSMPWPRIKLLTSHLGDDAQPTEPQGQGKKINKNFLFEMLL